MVNLFKRMRKLSTTLNVRTGLGAALFPTSKTATKEFPAVTRLHLTYAKRMEDGHRGARHFWRQCLPRLKYHNPSLGITVRQTDEQSGPAALTIYFSERLSSTASAIAGANQVVDSHAPAPGENEKSAVVNVKNLEFNEIWNRVQASTGAQEVKPTAEDEAEKKRLDAITSKSFADRERIASIRQAKRDQERMLAEARGEVEKTL